MNLLRVLNKPEYFFNPSQLLKRARLIIQRPPPGPMKFRLPWGATIEASVGETIGDSLLVLGVYDLVVSETLQRLIRNTDVVCDVGANVGVMTTLMASRLGATGKLHAFEAHPEIFRRLQSNLEPAKQNIVLINQAVSQNSGTVSLHIPEGFEDNQGLAFVSSQPIQKGRNINIPSTSLDDYFTGKTPPRVMKLDVENHELEVLR